MTLSYDYWKDREEKAREQTIRDEKRHEEELEEIYKRMFDEIQRDIDEFFAKYAATEGITIAEAKKRVSKLDMEEFERKAKKYVKEKDFSDQANEEMKLYNLTMKVNRLEMLKARIGLELVNGYQEIEDYMGEALTETTMKEIERHAGILGKTVGDNQDYAGDIVDASFHNATWSERIWANQDRLKYDLGKLLTSGLIQGKNPRELARDLQKSMNVSKYDAERLMRTEMCRVQIDASLREIEANGFTQFIFIADSGGSRTCEQCSALDGRTFALKDGKIGVNLPPVHPNCRCSIAGHVDDDEFLKFMDELGVEFTDEELADLGVIWSGEREESRRRIDPKATIDRNYIDSNEYKRKMEHFNENKEVTLAMEKAAVDMLKHRQGTKYEDIAVIDSRTGKTLVRSDGHTEFSVTMSKKQRKAIENNPEGTMIVIHNHPHSSSPSWQDIKACAERGYKYGIVVCHNGEIFGYRITKKEIDLDWIEIQMKSLDSYRAMDTVDSHRQEVDNIFKAIESAGVELTWLN